MIIPKLDRDPEPEFDTQPDTGLGLLVCVKCGYRGRGFSLCHCPTCHLTFTSIGGFDDHRTGSHAAGARKCRSEAEIRERGFEPNGDNCWRRPMTGPHWSAK